ncbi:hypothetical protein ACEN19_11190 [Corynebacterium auriscanis]|uniref:hypothetical protein n=1 Tax=Corynebacterium auriscanis TaxID=99807 RepID=UPI003CF5B576
MRSTTPGVWETNYEEGSEDYDLRTTLHGWIGTNEGLVFGRGLSLEDDEELFNLELAALAPELAEEVIRLRRELGTYISHLNDMADKDKHMPKHALDAISSALTRILEGGSDA